ncbi:NAD(P)/FAD-dependent oxidoreductase [Ramlibacter pallidus]|uniref:NAD(P)/FAD-dependent oxidoreductase n=1 Tax=Ramlibacter pallidus TaxID=2780087 RepID=A0ABR9S6S9_9BURK|nr:NAD(P)/FAD-dependent oxidoreductase [Ramlibacter pallidus]MBE7369007.1 NAD(P)/FAD-dependent oxidoreductase [Ramlibacter pallidus]
MTFDIAIIGGSFAGISAALPLARARRRVAVFDTGLRRNRFASASHGFFSQDGKPPGDIVAGARAQLLAYPTVTWIDAAAEDIEGNAASGFAVRAGGQGWTAQRVLFAMGVVDELPAIPGLQERWGRSVFHCPYCHGYELDRGRIGVIAAGPLSVHQAALLPEWGEVTFLLNGAAPPDLEQAQDLRARGVAVEAAPIEAVDGNADVLLRDGRRLSFDGLFTATRTRPASPLAQRLGCEMEDGPAGQHVRTNAMKETSVPGVFACGDVARAFGNVAMAVGDGAFAGTSIHRSLVFGLETPH